MNPIGKYRQEADLPGLQVKDGPFDPSLPAEAAGERTLADRAYAAIHHAIIEGTLQPGHRLRIEDLSANLQISPTPIREALNRLEAAGLAERLPHRGSRVREVSASEFRELYELRSALESLAIAKAAAQFTREEEEVAREQLDRLNAALGKDVLTEAWEAHTAFHFTLYGAARSPWLNRFISALWDSSRRYPFQLNNLRANTVQNGIEHERILEACVAHDSERAAAEMYNHVARNGNAVAMAAFGEAFLKLKT